MAKYVIDMDDFEPPTYDEYDGDDPRPGWYTFELQDVQVYDADTGKLQWIFIITDEPFKGWAGMMFGDQGSTKWINQQVNKAIQGGLEKPLSFDPDDDKSVEQLVKKAKRVKGKVEKRTYNDETRLVLRKVRPILEDASAGKTTRRTAPAEALTKAEEPVVEADADGTDDAPYTEDELAAMSLDDLKDILKDELGQEVPAKGRREKQDDYENKIIDLILAAQEAEEGGDAPEDNADDFGEGDAAFQEPEAAEEAPAEPAPTRRRRGAAAATTPAKAAPAKAAAAPATTRRRRG